ncbi:chain-length determining protein [Microbacterium sp. zg.Y909]|uniref:chain-length determining protein n=1 Tax=Microbacterium sp. zg.Y909 TaxID=2969413 RepID=UPI00214C8053|nr:chain-length determining protein [Microbacterium sp. zg.Y909]MCR2823916.1 chain-length determining protein [Microbacterium sp. zg.Y909]
MDPLAVIRTIWQQKWYALPALILAIAAAAFVYLEGPRVYESGQAYALANPQTPTEKQIDADPSLLELNADNPYLRSSDPNLIANVLITRLNSQETAERLASSGLTGEYAVTPGSMGGGLAISIAASGDSPEQAMTAAEELGTLLRSYLHEVQTVNGADERYLFTALVVSDVSTPTEKISSRLRAVIVVGVVGVAFLFGAVSLGKWTEVRRLRAGGLPRRRGAGREPECSDAVDDSAMPKPATTSVDVLSPHKPVAARPAQNRRSRGPRA